MTKIRAAVAGANGYAGMTAVRLLARHPDVELTTLSSRSLAGEPYAAAFPALGVDGRFAEEVDPRQVDVIFSCLPHNEGAQRIAGWFEAGSRVIDMSADFRLKDPTLYPRWYGQDHPRPDLLGRAVLGLPELHAGELPDAQLVAVPGCYSTCSILALAPAVQAGVVGSDVVIDAKSGVSGAGRSPGLGTHFSELDQSLHAYALAGHRHSPEVAQELAAVAPGGTAPEFTLVMHLVPMVRGILVTVYFDLVGGADELRDLYAEFYRGEPFTRVVPRTPDTKLAARTNLCLLNVAAQGRKAVVTGALDNLVKGASGQGIECFNIAFGLPRTAGLDLPVMWP